MTSSPQSDSDSELEPTPFFSPPKKKVYEKEVIYNKELSKAPFLGLFFREIFDLTVKTSSES